jgi:hypothetical protein
MSREYPQMRVRMPLPVKEWLQQSAERNCRSMNAEIVFWLETVRIGHIGVRGSEICKLTGGLDDELRS